MCIRDSFSTSHTLPRTLVRTFWVELDGTLQKCETRIFDETEDAVDISIGFIDTNGREIDIYQAAGDVIDDESRPGSSVSEPVLDGVVGVRKDFLKKSDYSEDYYSADYYSEDYIVRIRYSLYRTPESDSHSYDYMYIQERFRKSERFPDVTQQIERNWLWK